MDKALHCETDDIMFTFSLDDQRIVDWTFKAMPKDEESDIESCIRRWTPVKENEYCEQNECATKALHAFMEKVRQYLYNVMHPGRRCHP